ncbi:MAG: hypothetical protein ACYS8Z_02910 [Planctomycetota bacterium]|jgi:hypothetical protein
MRKNNRPTKRQLDLIEDLLTSELEEKAILKKHKLSPKTYTKWHSDRTFIEYYKKRIAAAGNYSAAVIARSAAKAAERLVKLTETDKGETARKACLDIIELNNPDPDPKKAANQPPQPPEQPPKINPKTAEKILRILAQEEGKPAEES